MINGHAQNQNQVNLQRQADVALEAVFMEMNAPIETGAITAAQKAVA